MSAKKPPPEPGSEPLDNQKHEGFALMIAEGSSGRKAYLSYYPHVEVRSADSAAARLLATVEVTARVKFLKRATASERVMTLQEWQEWHTMAVRTPIGEIDETHPLAQEMTYETKGGARGRLKRGQAEEGNEESSEPIQVVKIKSVCKQASAAQLAKHFGWTKDKVEGTMEVPGLAELLGSIVRPGLPREPEKPADATGKQ